MSRILTVDIGNSNIVVGSFDGEQLEFTGRIVTKRDYTTEKIVSEISALLSDWQSNDKASTALGTSYDGAILASVVPEITDKTLDALEKIIGKRPLLVGPFLRTGVDISRYKEGAIGMDRIVDVAAAVSLYGAPVMVCDLGTCTTITVVDSCSEDACQEGACQEDAGAYDRKEKPKVVACSDVEAGQDMELENPMDEEGRAKRDLFSSVDKEVQACRDLSSAADEEGQACRELSNSADEEEQTCRNLTNSVEKEEKYSGRIIGGMICPGVQLSLDAEATRASQLPQLSACEVDSLLGLDTASNMMSGVVAGTGMMIAELARRLIQDASSDFISGEIPGPTEGNTTGITQKDDLENRPAMKVVVTGGLGKLVIPWICSDGVSTSGSTENSKRDFEVHYEPDLLLYGLRYIYCLNCGD
ncbi:type III pantothenate kinase [Butyrivibrio sp. INlla14]|uniref:type III pantothenate kinase n=1 Tax=Butyrivibrio sp. INlla14 TaxID=1520808 RepID=UPI000876AC2E|nr:type III pantothenate kinase [Butyrivibrio sp. INlla14]SCY73736.1 pantothenate kinase, type III [Butyrivibrio sp. INlla14]